MEKNTRNLMISLSLIASISATAVAAYDAPEKVPGSCDNEKVKIVTSATRSERSEITVPIEEPEIPEVTVEPEVEIDEYTYEVNHALAFVPLDDGLQNYIYDLCEDYGLPFTLALAVIEVESNYDPSAVSRTGDYGLMQINKSNARYLERTLGVTDLLDAMQNAQAGVFILSTYYKKYRSSAYTLMAYNLGEPKAIDKWEDGIHTTVYSDKVLSVKSQLDYGR